MEREQQRQVRRETAPPPRQATPTSAPAAPPAPPEQAATRRQTLSSWLQFGAVAAGLAIGAVLPPLIGNATGDPGQHISAQMAAATLAYQPAPSLAMPKQAEPWSSCVASNPSSMLGDLDLVLAVDTTASMGRVIDDVKRNLQGLIANLAARGASTRIGVVAYRDVGDTYVTQPFPLTALDEAGVRALTAFVGGLRAEGGGDWPEAVDAALAAASSMAWRPGAAASIVVIGDAPVQQPNRPRANQVAANFASRAGGQVSVIDTGSGAHFFLRGLPEAGAGQYVTYDGNILNSLFPAITGCLSR